jgi:hypothetical protein
MTFAKHYSGDQIKNEMGGSCGTYRILVRPCEKEITWKT